MHYFIANWKANKNLNEAIYWIEKISLEPSWVDRAKIVICPPAHLIYPLRTKLQKHESISFGVQDISQFESGSYTGEITAKSLQGLVNYAIIGHSERRIHLNETNEIIKKKVGLAKKYNIEPILCVRNKEDITTQEVNFIAYEPVHSIGTGENESLEDILKVKKELNLSEKTAFFYGGSVNKDNVRSYLTSDEIKGFIIGTASKDPLDFFNIVSLS